MAATEQKSLVNLFERLVDRVDKLEAKLTSGPTSPVGLEPGLRTTARQPGTRRYTVAPQGFAGASWDCGQRGHIELRTAGSGGTATPAAASGKLETLSTTGQVSEGKTIMAHTIVSPITPTGGYWLNGTINGVQTSFLVVTGPTVTLLREDVCMGQIECRPPRVGTLVQVQTCRGGRDASTYPWIRGSLPQPRRGSLPDRCSGGECPHH